MANCSWCEKEVPDGSLIEHPLPDDDYIDICKQCSAKEQVSQEVKQAPIHALA